MGGKGKGHDTCRPGRGGFRKGGTPDVFRERRGVSVKEGRGKIPRVEHLEGTGTTGVLLRGVVKKPPKVGFTKSVKMTPKKSIVTPRRRGRRVRIRMRDVFSIKSNFLRDTDEGMSVEN